MGYSIDAITEDCYEGTACLINKLGIKDDKKLSEFEAAVTLAKAGTLEKEPIDGNFDTEHYKAIHRFLFEDIYDWAGKYRTIDMSKKGTAFAKADKICELMDACFERLKNNDFFRNQPFDEYVKSIVDFYQMTNMIHPFREGNGRTQRIFIAQLIRFGGYDISFSEIDSDELMIATIQAANGVTDNLERLFAESIK